MGFQVWHLTWLWREQTKWIMEIYHNRAQTTVRIRKYEEEKHNNNDPTMQRQTKMPVKMSDFALSPCLRLVAMEVWGKVCGTHTHTHTHIHTWLAHLYLRVPYLGNTQCCFPPPFTQCTMPFFKGSFPVHQQSRVLQVNFSRSFGGLSNYASRP